MKAFLRMMLPLLAIVAFSQSFASEEFINARPQVKNVCELRTAMRKLWEDHITWTRVYIMSALANLADQRAAANRLLQNQKDIGNAIKPFYGRDAGNHLTQLLTDHILIAVDIISAAKAGESDRLNTAVKKWYANADQIAAFLHSANPQYWPLAKMKMMMKMHLDLTTEELMARLNKNWTADVVAYDKVHREILMMADELTRGIAKQFPH